MGRLKDKDTRTSLIDLTLISFIHMFILMLALNFQWSSKALSKKALDKEETELARSQGLFKSRNSIALHHLRLSAEDKAELDKSNSSASKSDGRRSENLVHNSQTLRNLFLAERMNI